MAYQIIEKRAHSGNYSTSTSKKTHIVIHNTGNTASAAAEAAFAHNDRHDSSYHYVLDGKEIYHTVPDTMRAYSVGAWSGAKQIVSNAQSISIEVCSNGTMFTPAEVYQLTWLVQKLMKEHGIGKANVVRHYDCHTGHKTCPKYYIANERWSALRDTICGGSHQATETSKPAQTKLSVDGVAGEATVRRWQEVIGARYHDGRISGQSSSLKKYYTALKAVDFGSGGSSTVKTIQAICGVTQDGVIGKNTVKAIQKRLGVAQDGYFGTESAKALQRRLNEGKF